MTCVTKLNMNENELTKSRYDICDKKNSDFYDCTFKNGYGIDLVDLSILKSALINNFFKFGQTTDKL